MPQGLAQAMGQLLGVEIPLRKVVVWGGGHPISYKFPEDGWAAFRWEFPEVFGVGAGIFAWCDANTSLQLWV